MHVKGAPSVPDGFWESGEKADPSLRYLLRDATDRSLFRRESGRLRRASLDGCRCGYSDTETI